MKRVITILLTAALMFGASSAMALSVPDPLDPAVLHIGDPPHSGTYLYGDEVQPISNTHLGILENGSGQPTLLDPALLLILGVPNKTDSAFTAPSITLSSGTGAAGGTNLFSGSWNTSTGYAGAFTFDDVYDFIGFSPSGNASNLFSNWQAADWAVNGIDVDFFGIFVYTLTGTGITGGTTIDVDFGSALDNGTFVVAYGQDANGHSYTTPFTESGLTTRQPVPEPGTLVLLGAGFLGLAIYGKRRRNS